MRALAWLLLLFGPLLSLPAALGLWTRAHMSGGLYVPAAIAAAVLLEGLLLLRRGLLRGVTVFLLSGFWAVWMRLALTQRNYDWTTLPAWRAPDSWGLMIISLAVIICLVFYDLAEQPSAR